MNIVSLFAGCGGLDLGFERAGFKVIWANEYDKSIHETYRLNHPNTILNTADIRTITGADIPDCDGIIGGPPCQSWSEGGKCLGIEDERGKLVYDYIRIVKAKKPKFFIMENVPGMVTPRHIKSFKQFLSLYEEAGYQLKYELVNAADFKIPQDRLRVFIVGLRKDMNLEYFFPSAITKTPITLSQAIGDLPNNPRPYNKEKVLPDAGKVLNHDYYTGAYDRKYMARNRVRAWNEQSFTIQAQAKNEPLHPQAPKMIYVSQEERKFESGKEHLYRRLSVRECARIQTFPDKFKFIYSDIQDGYKMVGNAVPPRLAYHLAMSMNKCFSMTNSANTILDLALIGYVKSDRDFDTIRKTKHYYIRGGNRPSAMQFGQVSKPFKWLVLHRCDQVELYSLVQKEAAACGREQLRSIGFYPQGQEYWLFDIDRKIEDKTMLFCILDQTAEMKMAPQIVAVKRT
ncbi:MAG: DNA cytosine methyltransferase [Bacteroidaceae bacterium]|nr:DNA cytosine methyltransferase [Bacteroidaceae bacterium]